jgi:hypothetical protein
MLLTCFEEVRVAPSSQRDDKAQPGVSASEPQVHSRKCSPSCRDGRVVAAPKGFGVILIGVIRSVSVVARSVFGPFRAPRILSGFPGVRLRSPLAKVCRPIRDKMRASLVKPGCPQVLRHFSSSSTDSQADIPSPSTSLRRRLFGANYSTQLPARAYIRLDEAERSARIRDSGSQQPHGCSK